MSTPDLPACYVSTTLPGSGDHCVAETREEFLAVQGARVWHGADIFLHSPVFPGNCGDLCFSGHMLLLTFGCKLGAQGTAQLRPNNARLRIGTRIGFTIAFVMQCLGTIAKRNHYTVDILLGIFVAYACARGPQRHTVATRRA